MEEAAATRIFQSACLLVAVEGQPVVHQAYGRAELDTVFDLASLTKPLATTAVLMQLTAQGILTPGSRLLPLVPELERPETRSLRLWHLLAHASGLPAWRPFYEAVQHLAPSRRRREVRALAATLPLEARPGSREVYSDVGFILLDWALERATGTRLDRLATRLVYRPLGLRRTFFVDLSRDDGDRHPAREIPVAPTERCPWRKRRLHGEVHDDNCWAMGGIAGHAGLFSTAYEVHLLTRELVSASHGGRSIFDAAVVRRFFCSHPLAGSTRVLGWDTPASRGATCGRHFGPHTVGHLGFTGTSLWIDLERSLWVVLLTNRVFYGREPNPMKAFRPRLHDAVMRAVR
jgi:CubicO group peptidase (beta-lactamase class C family)